MGKLVHEKTKTKKRVNGLRERKISGRGWASVEKGAGEEEKKRWIEENTKTYKKVDGMRDK